MPFPWGRSLRPDPALQKLPTLHRLFRASLHNLTAVVHPARAHYLCKRDAKRDSTPGICLVRWVHVAVGA